MHSPRLKSSISGNDNSVTSVYFIVSPNGFCEGLTDLYQTLKGRITDLEAVDEQVEMRVLLGKWQRLTKELF